MITKIRELEAYGPPGADVVRPMRFPEHGSRVAFDCTRCGTHTDQPFYGVFECGGCDAWAAYIEVRSQS